MLRLLVPGVFVGLAGCQAVPLHPEAAMRLVYQVCIPDRTVELQQVELVLSREEMRTTLCLPGRNYHPCPGEARLERFPAAGTATVVVQARQQSSDPRDLQDDFVRTEVVKRSRVVASIGSAGASLSGATESGQPILDSFRFDPEELVAVSVERPGTRQRESSPMDPGSRAG